MDALARQEYPAMLVSALPFVMATGLRGMQLTHL
jgi:hypothetical protein